MGISTVLPIVFSIILFGALGSFQDAEAGFVSRIVWTGEGDGMSWTDPNNWRETMDPHDHRVPNSSDIIYIDDRCDDPFLPEYQVNNAVVHMDDEVDFTVFGTIVVCSDDTLVIDDDSILRNRSGDSIENSGTLIIDGLLVNAPPGEINNNGEILVNNVLRNIGTINNNEDGVINNEDTINNNDGTINNNEGGVINNNSQLRNNDDGIIRNFSIINNEDTINNNNDASIFNNEGGVINNEDTINNNDDGFIRNRGTINNEDSITNTDDGRINNNPKGIINNNDGGLINNENQFDNGGTINNKGDIDTTGDLNNIDGGVINNDDTITNESLFSINNEGIINNGIDGVIENDSGHIDNMLGALILNQGVINNGGETIDNEGTIINQCTGEINGDEPNDIDDGITFNRSCNGSLYSISRDDTNIREIDPTTGETVSEIEITIDDEEFDDFDGGTGLAVDPTTGTLWAMLKVDCEDCEGRQLATIDLTTGEATVIGDTGDRFAGIAFDSAGNLFGGTGDGADVHTTLFSISKTDGSTTELCEFGEESDDDGEVIAYNSANGLLYHGSSDDIFQTIDGTSGETCDLTDIELSEEVDEFTALTFGEDEGLFFGADLDDEFFTISANPGEVIFIDEMDHQSKGLAFVPFSEEPVITTPSSSAGSGSTTSQDPNLGDVRYGRGHDNGFCMNQNCITVNDYFNHFPETTVPQGSTQTFSVLVNCPRGANTCNHIEIAGALPDSDFYDYQWAASIDRQPRSENWDLTTNNPYGEIGEVTVTVQTVSQSFVSASFNIPFLIPGSIGTHDGIGDPQENNRHLHVTVWDNKGGSSNYIFNEGVYVDDIYAYPQVETSYDAPIEYEQQCLNENSNKRYTCAFDKVKDWTIKNAEEKLKEIYDEHR